MALCPDDSPITEAERDLGAAYAFTFFLRGNDVDPGLFYPVDYPVVSLRGKSRRARLTRTGSDREKSDLESRAFKEVEADLAVLFGRLKREPERQ